MKDKVKISQIVIEIADKQIELTLEQAKELHKILNDAFPQKEIQYIPGAPIYIEKYRDYRPYWWDVNYGSGTSANPQFDGGFMKLTCKAS